MKNQLALLGFCLFSLCYCQTPSSENENEPAEDTVQIEDAPAADTDNTQEVEAKVTYKAQGNEPFWSIEIMGEEAIRYTTPEMEVTFPFVPPILSPSSNPSEVYAAKTTEHDLRMVIFTEEACTDDMSGKPFPNTVEITFDDQKMRGCGRPVTR
jgi:uncharacterized membrane protein